MEKDIIIEQATKKENIGAAFAIHGAWPDSAKQLIKNLTELVIRKIEGEQGQWKIDNDFDFNSKHTGFYFTKESWNSYGIRFEFDEKYANALAYGVVKSDERKTDENDKYLSKKLDENIKNGGEFDECWTWWQYYDDPYRNWNLSAEPWTGICQGGKTVDVVASMLERIIECVADDIDRIEGIRKPDSTDASF